MPIEHREPLVAARPRPGTLGRTSRRAEICGGKLGAPCLQFAPRKFGERAENWGFANSAPKSFWKKTRPNLAFQQISVHWETVPWKKTRLNLGLRRLVLLSRHTTRLFVFATVRTHYSVFFCFTLYVMCLSVYRMRGVLLQR